MDLQWKPQMVGKKAPVKASYYSPSPLTFMTLIYTRWFKNHLYLTDKEYYVKDEYIVNHNSVMIRKCVKFQLAMSSF